jgi:hypothetical protein
MKNTKKKLVVSRETIQMLEEKALQQVQGGIISCFCSGDCPAHF